MTDRKPTLWWVRRDMRLTDVHGHRNDLRAGGIGNPADGD
jgi:hypothetical protein